MDRIFVATHKGLFTVERGGSGAWRVVDANFLGDDVSLVHSEGKRVWAALALGHFGVKLRRSLDHGASWREVAAPTYPPKPPNYNELDDRDGVGKPFEWRVDKIWALASGGGNRLWCGTIPGGLFRSDDAGESWSLNRPLWDRPERHQWFGGGADTPGLHSISVDPRDPTKLHVGVSCGGVWMTEDDGASWQPRADGMWAAYVPPERKHDPVIQDPHCVVRCRAQPDMLWAQHHNGIFRSTDNGASWREIAGEPSSFGFAVAVHPRDPETAWFVPAVKDECRVPVDGQVVVSRTRDGGRSFEVLREGLPQEHAYDLVYRHALDIDASGERLAFGSTTGSLWVSDDQGDHWTAVSTHLPPIVCVRFA
jgi:hypothetical protein